MAESQWGFPGWARDNNFSSSVTSILDREGFTSLEALLNCERHDLEALEIGRGHLVSLRTAVTKLQAEHGGGPLCEARERVSELVVKQATVHDRLSQNWQDQPQPSDNNTATSKGRETGEFVPILGVLWPAVAADEEVVVLVEWEKLNPRFSMDQAWDSPNNCCVSNQGKSRWVTLTCPNLLRKWRWLVDGWIDGWKGGRWLVDGWVDGCPGDEVTTVWQNHSFSISCLYNW